MRRSWTRSGYTRAGKVKVIDSATGELVRTEQPYTLHQLEREFGTQRTTALTGENDGSAAKRQSDFLDRNSA